MTLVLAIGFAEEAADIMLGRREHGDAGIGDKLLLYAATSTSSGRQVDAPRNAMLQ
jgi:predicted nucleic acid-binding protein